MIDRAKLSLFTLLLSLFFLNVGCKKLDIDANCLNPLAACFKPDKTAPSVKSYSPVPNKGSNLVSVLTAIQVNFSEEMKDRTNKEHYTLTGPGAANLKVASVDAINNNTVQVNITGQVANNAIDLEFPGLTDYGGNALPAGTKATFTGSINIGITTQESPAIYYISNVAGFTSAVIHWYHDYADDNNNLYYVQPAGSSCAESQVAFPGGGTNLSGGPVTAGSANVVTTTIPIATNFTGDGTYIVTICVKNSGANKSGELEIPVVRDTVAPTIQANIGSGAYGTPQNVTFTCSENCNNIAYTLLEGTSMPANPATPVFNATTGSVTTGTALTGAWQTPYVPDPRFSKINLKAFDKAGNQSTTNAYIFSYQIDLAMPTTTFASPATTHDYLSTLAGAYNSTILTWSADKGSQYQICVGDTGVAGASGCAAGPACNGGTNLFGTAQAYTPGATVNTTINATSLAVGANRIHVCVQSGATVGDATYTLNRDNTAPAIAATVPTDGANGVLPTTTLTVNFTEATGVDVQTLTTNNGGISCTGNVQLSLASDNFAPNKCIPLSSTVTTISAQSFRLSPTPAGGRLSPGLYKLRLETGVKDLAGNTIAAQYTQPTGFTVTGLLRMFTFNNDGTNLIDQAGSGFNLTVNGTPQKVTGVDGDTSGAYQFDSVTQYLTGSDSLLPAGASPRTLCAWAITSNQCPGLCMATMYGTSANGPYIGFWNGKAVYGIYGNDHPGNANLPIETWVHLCSTYDGTTARMYVNGIQDASQASVWTTNLGAGIAVGKQSAAGTDFALTGKVDDVRIYAGALTASEIRQISVQLPNGLVAYFPFSDSASLTAIDYSGNAHNGTRNNNPGSVADRFGVGASGAYNFTNNTQSITAPGANLPAGTSPRTVCSWMRPAALPGAGGFAIAAMYGTNATGQGNYIGLYNDGVNQNAIYSGWGDHLIAVHTAPLNTWLHLCGTYDGTTAQLFLNGTQVASAGKSWNTVPVAANGGIHIGRGDATTAYPFTGAVDDVRIYNRVLSAEEIRTLAAQKGIGLVRQYLFKNGSLTNDAAGSTDLTATGSPVAVTGHDGSTNSAYLLNGTSQFFNAADTGLPMGGAARTMCAWANSTNTSGSQFMMSYGVVNVTSQNSFLALNNGGTILAGSFSTNLSAPGAFQYNVWQHVCGVVDGTGNVTLYVDGSIPANGGPSPITFATLSSGAFSIGSRSDNLAGSYWDGRLDNIRIYNRALTQIEIQQMQNE